MPGAPLNRDSTPEARARRMEAYLSRRSPGTELDPQRMLEIRLRIASGYYDRHGVNLTTAEKLLTSGDISLPSPDAI